MQFGRRVLGLLKTSHIARERDKKKIKELEKLVTDLSACEASGQPPISTEDPDMGTLHLKVFFTIPIIINNPVVRLALKSIEIISFNAICEKLFFRVKAKNLNDKKSGWPKSRNSKLSKVKY